MLCPGSPRRNRGRPIGSENDENEENIMILLNDQRRFQIDLCQMGACNAIASMTVKLDAVHSKLELPHIYVLKTV